MIQRAVTSLTASKQWATDVIDTLVSFWARIGLCAYWPASNAIDAFVSSWAIAASITRWTTYTINTYPTIEGANIRVIGTEDWRQADTTVALIARRAGLYLTGRPTESAVALEPIRTFSLLTIVSSTLRATYAIRSTLESLWASTIYIAIYHWVAFATDADAARRTIGISASRIAELAEAIESRGATLSVRIDIWIKYIFTLNTTYAITITLEAWRAVNVTSATFVDRIASTANAEVTWRALYGLAVVS